MPLTLASSSSSTHNPSYGSVPEHAAGAISVSSERTALQDDPLPKWTLYNMARFTASILHIVIAGTALSQLASNDYEIDPVTEGPWTTLVMTTFGAHGLYWLYCLVVSISIIFLKRKQLADALCTHMIALPIADFLLGLVNMRSFYIHDAETTAGFKFTTASVVVDLLLLTITIHEERHLPLRLKDETGRFISAENRASLYSRFLFSYINPLMKEGHKRTLNDDDLDELPYENKAKNSIAYYRHQKRARMLWSLLRTFKEPLTEQFFYCVVWSLAMFGPPFALNRIVKFIEDPEGQSTMTAFLYVLGMFLASTIQSLSYQQGLYIGRVMGIRIQSIVIGEVYAKALKRKEEQSSQKESSDKQQPSKSNINNLLSVDAQKMGDLAAYIFYIYCFPIQITVSIYCLYQLLGVAALYGVVIMILSQPIIYKLSNMFQKIHRSIMGFTDRRMKLVNEMLAAIRIVKFFAWEKEFHKRIMEAREVELKGIRKRLFMYMWMGNVWFLLPVIIMVTVFYVYTLDHELTASTAFTALALFNTFKQALDDLPLITSWLLQANVSMKRVEDFLQQDEVETVPSSVPLEHKTTIGFFDNASFRWETEGDAPPIVSGLNLAFPHGKLSIICGATGSGKSTLLASLLGETHCLSGSAVLPRRANGSSFSGIAYVAQTAWLQNRTIRDNILFGLPYDKERYEKVLFMCALVRDLEILEFGDQTEVGERGITLSGGQKQRVAIARAVYSNADIVILDDCLSAVDAHTAKHLYEQCLMGELLRSRTVILVTHHVSLCIKGADYVVAMREGQVEASGKPADVIATGALGEDFSLLEDSSDEETCGSTVIMPTTDSSPSSSGSNKKPATTTQQSTTKNDNGNGGKLVLEEKRAEGSVSWKVYSVYFYASGGFIFWLAVLLFFVSTQVSIMGQDYWIKVWSSAYEHKRHASIVVASAFHALGEIPYLTRNTFSMDSYTGHEDKVDVKYYLGIYFLIGMISLTLATLRQLTLFTGSLRASRRVHVQLLDKILHAKVRFFDSTPLGRIVNRFSSDMETIDQALAPSMAALLYAIIGAVAVVVLISSIIPAFLIPGAFIAALFWWIGTYYLDTSRDLKRLNAVSRSPIYVQFHESVNGVATIRAFGCQQRFIEENFEKIDNNNRPFIWMWTSNRWLHCRVDILGALVGFCTGFTLIMAHGSVQAGLAGLALSYSLIFTRSILWTVRQYAMFEMNCNSIERVQEYLNIEQEPAARTSIIPRPQWPETGAVKVKDLVMQYAPDTPAVLRGLSFETRSREKIGIVGRTGSGKSTLALSMFRFMEATSGSITIDNVDISTLGLEDLRSRLTIIPQDPILFTGTLRSNMDPFGEYDDAELYAALKRAQLTDVESLDTPVAENGSNWSQGQRQLIALARALVKRSSLIILDEATSSVDFTTDQKIQQTIRREFVSSSLLCIAHRIRTVADYDRILVLDQGRVVEFDTPFTLMTRDGSLFQQMCERSGEFSELLAIAKAKHDNDSNQS
ncbi:hypothetical protein LRAMOSA06642 [Lichtheimia ramosa]|uniref:Uncharacterized protein n=1 Tax=Lichtheimia ramosa TaxID=688394 RepID=A0A077X541_9FUNG|nr:hypothetical protein LRAMOSA06642 [Lichtheimia ramosa]